MEDRIANLRVAVASLDVALSELLPARGSAVFEVERNEATDLAFFEAEVGRGGKADGKGGVEEDYGNNVFMEEFLVSVNGIKRQIAEIGNLGSEIRRLKQQMMATATSKEEKAISQRLEGLLTKANNLILATKTGLEKMKAANDEFASANAGTGESRIRQNAHSSLTRRFRELLTQYQALQTDYKKSVKEKIARQVKVVAPELSELEVAEIVDSADTSVAQQKIFGRILGTHESLNFAYQDIQDKHRDVKRLENSVQDLHQMFVNLALLVEHQGDLLDQVSFAVNNAADFTEKADKDLLVAQKNQAKRKRWMCIISSCLILLVLIITIPIVVMFVK